MPYHVYIMTNRPHGVLYTGVARDLERRVEQHKADRSNSFVSRYGLHHLVWAQVFDDVNEAIAHEKRLKKWRRDWKIRLIEENNPDWLPLI